MLLDHPIDGQWSSWGSWAECSKTCGGGSQTRSRVCTSPAPENGGLPCQGSASDTKECKTFACSGNGATIIGLFLFSKMKYSLFSQQIS